MIAFFFHSTSQADQGIKNYDVSSESLKKVILTFLSVERIKKAELSNNCQLYMKITPFTQDYACLLKTLALAVPVAHCVHKFSRFKKRLGRREPDCRRYFYSLGKFVVFRHTLSSPLGDPIIKWSLTIIGKYLQGVSLLVIILSRHIFSTIIFLASTDRISTLFSG